MGYETAPFDEQQNIILNTFKSANEIFDFCKHIAFSDSDIDERAKGDYPGYLLVGARTCNPGTESYLNSPTFMYEFRGYMYLGALPSCSANEISFNEDALVLKLRNNFNMSYAKFHKIAILPPKISSCGLLESDYIDSIPFGIFEDPDSGLIFSFNGRRKYVNELFLLTLLVNNSVISELEAVHIAQVHRNKLFLNHIDEIVNYQNKRLK